MEDPTKKVYAYLDGDGPAVLVDIEELEQKIAPDQSSAGFLD